MSVVWCNTLSWPPSPLTLWGLVWHFVFTVWKSSSLKLCSVFRNLHLLSIRSQQIHPVYKLMHDAMFNVPVYEDSTMSCCRTVRQNICSICFGKLLPSALSVFFLFFTWWQQCCVWTASFLSDGGILYRAKTPIKTMWNPCIQGHFLLYITSLQQNHLKAP